MSVTNNALVRFKPQMFGLSQIGENILWYVRTDAGILAPTEDNVLDALDALFAPLYKALIGANASYIGSSLQVVEPVLSVLYTNGTRSGAGTAAGDLMSTQTAGLIGKKTTRGGRKYRGRAYIPFPTEGDSALGLPTAGYLTRLNALASQIVSTVTVGGTYTFEPWLVGRDPPIPPATETILVRRARLNNQVIGAGWATQRRRGYYGRINPGIIT